MKQAFLLTFLLLIAFSLVAQVRGPVTGTVYDDYEKALRPMVGMLGAAYLGAPLTGALDGGLASPDGRLAVAAEGGSFYLLRGLDTGQLRSAALPRGSGVPERMSWSGDSSTVAVQTGGRILLYSGVSEPPRGRTAARRPRSSQDRALSVAQLDLSDLGTITALAVDDSGSVLVGAAGGLFRLAADGDRTLLAAAESVSGIALAEDRLYVTDRSRNEVLEINNWRDSADVALFANQSQGVDDPVGVALSRDGRSLWVAGGGSRSVTQFDLVSRRMLRSLALGFEPTRLSPLGDGTVMLLNERDSESQALQALEDGPDARVYFVPAASAAQLAALNPVED
ncbi:MAG: hypothetical protein GY953_46720 [bacterium]|nr:hypothetical protein [bacterium]